jgi:c-di-AMP phosphodiesterase-like protein
MWVVFYSYFNNLILIMFLIIFINHWSFFKKNMFLLFVFFLLTIFTLINTAFYPFIQQLFKQNSYLF